MLAGKIQLLLMSEHNLSRVAQFNVNRDLYYYLHASLEQLLTREVLHAILNDLCVNVQCCRCSLAEMLQ